MDATTHPPTIVSLENIVKYEAKANHDKTFWIRIRRDQKPLLAIALHNHKDKIIREHVKRFSVPVTGCVLDVVDDGDYAYLIPHFRDAKTTSEPLEEIFDAKNMTLAFKRKKGARKAVLMGAAACTPNGTEMQSPMLKLTVSGSQVTSFTPSCVGYSCLRESGCQWGLNTQNFYSCVCTIMLRHHMKMKSHKKHSTARM